MSKLKLETILKQRKMTGKDLALLVGVTPNTISSIKNHEKSPTFDTLSKIAKALNINVCDLIEAEPNESIYVIIRDELHTFNTLSAFKEFATELNT